MKYYLAALQKYAVFTGRARRSEYWYFVLFSMVFYLSTVFISTIVTFSLGRGSSVFLGVIILIYVVAMIIPYLSVAVRRLHDIDKSGWHILIGLIPLIGGIWLLVLYFTEGTPGPNRYGADPKQPEGLDEIEQIGSNE